LFSLGIVMWEVLTTEKLFRRNSDFETMQSIVSDDVPPPSKLRPDVPREVDHIVQRLLAKDAAQRYQTADELHEAIENVAVRTGSALSTSSLGRYMRELFGQRPEPWIELAVHEQMPEAFTVTSEPIPNNLRLSAADDFDRKLSAVPALTQRLTAQTQGARPPQLTPLRVDAQLLNHTTLGVGSGADADPRDLMRTQPIRESAPRIRNVVEFPGDRKQPSQPPTNQSSSMPHIGAFTPPGEMRAHTPSHTPPSSPHYPIASSASHRAFTGMPPSYPIQQRAQTRAHPTGKRSLALFIIVPAAVIGIVIGIALAVGGDDKPKEAVATETDDSVGSTKTMIATLERPAPPIEKHPEQPPAAVMPAATMDTTKPTEPTAPRAPSPATDEPLEMPEDQVAKPDRPEKKSEPRPDVAAMFRKADYADAVAACSASSRMVALNATVCTLSACKVKNAAKAKKWFAQVGAARRASVLDACDGVIAVEKPAPASNVCKTDPMACQH
jgi:hypothetical protein